MANKKSEGKNKIDRYLLGQLEEQERVQFHLELIQNPKLQSELATQETIMKSLWASKAKPGSMQKTGNLRLAVIGISILILGAGLLFFSTKARNSPNPQTVPTVSNPIPVVPESSLTHPDFHEVPQKEAESSQEKPDKGHAKEKQNPIIIPADEANKEPAIATNFIPNPNWENYIGSHIRSNKIQVTIEKPGAESSTNLVNGAFTFECLGEIKTMGKTLQGDFKIHLFSNRTEDFNEFRPLKSWNLKTEKEASSYAFHLQESLAALPGLYYYLLEEADTGIWYYVGKLSVSQSK